MRKIPVILDGDPGHDDAIAWMIAAASPLLDIKAVTTVAGNKDLNNVTANAAKLCELFGIRAPLAKGARGPLVVAGITAGEFHGKTGLDGVELPVKGVSVSSMSAVELMVQVLEESKEPVVIIGTGAQTNLATLLLYRPDLKRKIRAFHIMGGGIGTGNWNPAAEFNILVDPEAARIVSESGVPIVLNGLDVTERALIYPEEIDRIRALNTPLSHIVACWLDFFGETHKAMGYSGWPMHDPCAVLSLLEPSLFTMRDAYLQVETDGLFTRGATLADFEDVSHYNARIVLDVRREAFIEKIIETVKFYGPECGKPQAQTAEAVEKTEDAPGKTENARGKAGEAPGKTEDAPGKTENAPACLAAVRIFSSDSADQIREKILRHAPCSLLLTEGPGNTALALKVWPQLTEKLRYIYYAGGTLQRGDATAWAEQSVFAESKKLESLLNSGVPVVFATLEAARRYGLTAAGLAEACAGHPENYETLFCGIHVEFQSGNPAEGRMICDRRSDKKFERKNAYVIL